MEIAKIIISVIITVNVLITTFNFDSILVSFSVLTPEFELTIASFMVARLIVFHP